MVREGSLAITHADIGNDYHTVTLFEDGAGCPPGFGGGVVHVAWPSQWPWHRHFARASWTLESVDGAPPSL